MSSHDNEHGDRGRPSHEGHTRRDFLQVLGVSSVALAACSRAPARKIVPAARQPEELTPGVAVHYASTCGGCAAACGILVKTRDGRPIKIEGSTDHPISRGGTCARGQAMVLSLYDAARARGPQDGRSPANWATLDAAVIAGLRAAVEAKRSIFVVTPPPGALGPTVEAAMTRLLAAYPGAERLVHDPLGEDAVAEAHLQTHGLRAAPLPHLERARLVVSLGADFLGTWRDPVALTRRYVAARDPSRGADMLRHIQIESHLSLSGSNADQRIALSPSEMTSALAAIAARSGVEMDQSPAARTLSAKAGGHIERVAAELHAARGHALLLCGLDDPAAQVLANAVNEKLGAYAAGLLDLAAAPAFAPVRRLDEALADIDSGKPGAVLFIHTNPVYDHPRGEALAAALARIPLTASTADRRDETGRAVRWLAPDHHALESWSDAQPERGLIALRQPVVRPLHGTRALTESLTAWSGAAVVASAAPADDQLRARWAAEVHPRAILDGAPLGFAAFFERAQRDGFARIDSGPAPAIAFRSDAIAPAVLVLANIANTAGGPGASAEGSLELVLHPSLTVGDGRLANNAWLAELPDPITKITWGNAAALAPATAKRLGLRDGDMVRVSAPASAGTAPRSIELPIVIQPGTHPRVLAIALGHGRRAAGPVGDNLGANGFGLAAIAAGRIRRMGVPVSITRTGHRIALARTQTHDSLEQRPIVRELRMEGGHLERPEWAAEEAKHGITTANSAPGSHSLSMWSGHKYEGHRWAMAIDLNACTGCSGCLVSCQAENNIPVVGADEVRRRRELHWLRIDRYYQGDPESPEVVHQPMLCQHCENAPCETVCPVLATVHSAEGLNQQVYNRCVGTRYCANNCPVKVRRFNWFDYSHEDLEARLVLNPDVTVRSRGVMEKCSFCVQRIQAARTAARLAGRDIADGDIRPACAQGCPADAIVFGDLNDPRSRIARLAKEPRGYRVLSQLGIGSSVTYLARVRNRGEGA